MRAILLAAGRGRRLEDTGWLKPKCLLPVGDTTILDHMLEALRSHGVQDVVLVVGYQQELVRACAGRHGLRLAYVENPDYENTNTINSLWRAAEHMAGDFLYFNADVLFHPDVLGRLLEAPGSRLAVDHKSCAEEEVKVVLDEDGRVVRIGKQIDPALCAGEFIGIGKFCREMNGAFVESLRRHNVELANQGLFFEAALDDILEQVELREVDVSDLPTIEIDFAADLEEARAEVAPRIARGRGGRKEQARREGPAEPGGRGQGAAAPRPAEGGAGGR